MAKVFVRQSTAVFGIIILLLLVLCVGLLVVVLKGQMYHESLNAPIITSHRVGLTSTVSSTSALTSVLPPRIIVTRTTNGNSDGQLTTEAQPSSDAAAVWENFRLPRHVVPLHYDLLLFPNLGNDTFSGKVNITVNVTDATRQFIVHAYKLNIIDTHVENIKDGSEVSIKKAFLYDPNEYFVMEIEGSVPPGQYKLHLSFKGSLVGSIVGFYKSRYFNRITNETRYLATSKFQPTYARRAFPCFDEPSFKSTFSVSLVHEPEYIALSNMPANVTETYASSNLKVTRFEKSVPMVTYLACFIVCDFKFQETTTSDGKKFRVYATPDQVSKTDYALKFGARVLEYFEDYFGIIYPLPKQDMVAIPDFVSGAMEHWGVITFRETNLLYDDNKSSPQNKQRVSTVISHEMAHMWFGNLVTMEWWNDLWLNEGFASYVEYKGVDEQHPEWDMLDQFATEDLQSVMDRDSTMSSHPIVQPVSHPDEITEIFDDISYNKGASVLRMLEFFVGKENFRKGIAQFLKKHQYGNAKTEDLWQELSEVAGFQTEKNISTIMNTWTCQMGFPYISVVRHSENSSLFTAKQQRFVKNPELYRESRDSSEEYIWSVPLSYITANGQSGIVWLHDGAEKNFTIPDLASEWVKFNVNQTGYYLVKYDEKEWEKLIELLKTDHKVMSPSDRSNMLFDTFLLAEAGHINYDILLGMTMYLKNENHLIPWETAYASLVYLSQLLEFTDVNFLIKSYIKELTSSLYGKLGWKEGDGHLDNLLRTTIIGLACHSGNQDCLNEASELFQNWTQGNEIPTTLRSLVYHYGMSEIGREEHWNYMWQRYLQEESPQERKTLLYGLAHVRIPALIHRYLDYAMDETKIRRQDFFSILSYTAGNTVGRPIVWNFLRDKWKLLVDRFTLNDRYLGLTVKKICSYFSSEFELQEMKQFFKKYPDAGAGKRRREQALENVQNNIKWLQTYKKHIQMWLQTEGNIPWFHYRLPSHIVPLHYDLTLHPDMNNDMFNGKVTITVKLGKPSNYFLVNAHKLNISMTKVMRASDDSDIQYERVFAYEPNDYWVIQMLQKLPPGDYKLYFEFQGNLSGSLIGFYKSSYFDNETKQKRYLATSQFQSTYARRAFPCFDEPKFKSTFTIKLIHEPDYFAISNTLEAETILLENGLKETRFEKSVPMVTYLVCLIVCDFKYMETYTEGGIRFRVYATPHNQQKTAYALEIGSKILTFFEKYFDVPYPLKKQDMIAIPDFRAGAMENWGLITFRERFLLVDESDTSINDKFSVAFIISHELAHMWFGNLVTMEWWDDLWLNEGFASYIEYLGVQHVEPSWSVKEQFTVEDMYVALTLDSVINSHPIVQTVNHPNEISELFDQISYSKGSSILRMLESLMGEDFRQGISAYLKKYSFDNAKTEDLWTELTNSSKQGLNISLIMNTWTRQMNYPYVTIKKNKLDSKEYTVQQHHYISEPENKSVELKHSPFGYTWQIPLTYFTSENYSTQFIILNTTDEVILNIPNAEWVKFNVNFTGFYLVNYEKEEWKIFEEILEKNHTVFSPSNRANILYDSFALARAGLLSYDVPLDLTKYLTEERHFVPWKTCQRLLNHINKLLEKNDNEAYELLQEHIRVLTKNLLRELSWTETGDYLERRLRILIIEMACRSGNNECLQWAETMLKKWMDEEILSPNFRSIIYHYGMENSGDEVTWNYMWQRFLQEPSSQERKKLISGLANIRNGTLLQRFLNFSLDGEKIRRQDYFSVLTSISQNPVGHPIIWNFLQSNWSSLVERFTLNDRGLGIFVKNVCIRFTTKGELLEVEEFFRKYPNAGAGKSARAEALEVINNNIKWIEKYKTIVHGWLKTRVYMPWQNLRLPRHIIPVYYNLTIQPNMTSNVLNGYADIVVNITEPTDYILIHSEELTILNTTVYSDTSESIQLDETFPFKRNYFWIIRFADSIVSGSYRLHFEFLGPIYEQRSYGLSKSSYTDSISEEERYLLATEFEPTHARKVFPCFDEPGFKSKFKITLVHDPNYFAISNMPEEVKTPRSDGLMETRFEESVPMVTYLVCFIVSDYDFSETTMSQGRKLRIYAPPDRINKTLHVLSYAPAMLSIFEEYFNIPYILPKLDFVAIPNYVVPAMENWGLITFNSNRLLAEGSSGKLLLRDMVDKVIAHELAHQWFGNLVTMKWWNDLWLNEGFSTFASYIALRHIHPTADNLATRRKTKVMRRDATLYSHPIVHSVNDPDEITELFDDISYEKGAAILQMLQFVLQDSFRKGVSNASIMLVGDWVYNNEFLNNYLKKYMFSNAETTDLWNELSDAAEMDINITEVMNTWTCQMGFPYVEITRTNTSFTATQQWFLRKPEEVESADVSESRYGYIWKIPLVYKDMQTGQQMQYWLNEKNATFDINISRDACVKFNPDFFGYYIINYDEADWTLLIKNLQNNHESFSVSDRYNLLHDAFVLAEAEKLLYDVPLEISKYLKMEREFLPWNLAKEEFKAIANDLVEMSETHQLLQKYVADLTDEIFDEVVWNDTRDSDDRDLWNLIIRMACINHNSKCLEKISMFLEQWSIGEEVPLDYRLLIFKFGMWNFGNETLWEKMWMLFTSDDTDEDESDELMVGLSYVQNITLIERYLNYSELEQSVSASTYQHMLYILAENPIALPIMWNYIKDNWEQVLERCGSLNQISQIVSHMCYYYKSEEKLKEVIQMFKAHPEIDGRIQERCFAGIQKREKWLKKNEEPITNWLRWNVES